MGAHGLDVLPQGEKTPRDAFFLRKIPQSPVIRLRHIPFALRMIGIGLLVVALARPQRGTSEEEVTTEGVDIMLVLDVSFSMKSLDFQPKNRLFVAKETIKDFVKKRRNDRIGLVIFAKRSYTKCPLTLDYNILLTDGGNNFGEIAPLAAAKAAAELGIKIYTIGVGKDGEVPYPVEYIDPSTGKIMGQQIQMVHSDLDEQLLVDVSHSTNGTFFRAQNAEKLKEIYATIDKMEKTEIKTKLYTSYSDRFFPWLVAGCLVLVLEIILSQTLFRRIP